MTHFSMRFLPSLALVLSLFASASAQGDSKETRTLKLRLQEARLVLSESEADLGKSEAAWHEAQSLFDKGLYNKVELSSAESQYRAAQLRREQASINLEKTRLAFLNDAMYISLEKASLYRDEAGLKHALLRLKNSSNSAKLIDDEGAYNDADKKSLLSIENLSVRLLNDGNLIGRPFEYKIPALGYNQSRDVDFVLQRETEAVTVEIAYGDTVVRLPVFLEKEAKEDHAVLQAMQFSLEGELGRRVAYDLEIERFVDDSKTFSIEVVNLPGDFMPEFYELDSASNTPIRVSRIRFKKGITTKQLQLVINMPKELDKQALDKKVSFFVVLVDQFTQQRLASLKSGSQGRPLSADELDSAGISKETLELIPRGQAEMTITASNFFKKIRLGDMVKFAFELGNTGTVKLDRVRVKLTLPADWTANVTPEKDISLEVEEKKQIQAEVIPAMDAVAGDYEIKIETETTHEGRRIEAVAKVMRVQIEGRSNFLVGAILMILVIGIVVGVAVMTIRIARR